MPQTLDPRIPLMVEPAKIDSPLETIKTVAEFRRIVNDEKVRRQNEEAQKQIQAIMAESGGDWEVAIQRLKPIAPQYALKLETDVAEMQKKAGDAVKVHLENQKATTDRALRMFQAVGPNGEGYEMWRAGALQAAPDMEQFLPPQWTGEELRERVMMVGLTAKELDDRKLKALERKDLFGYLATALNQQEWDEILKSAKALGVPQAQIDLVPREFSPENRARIAQMSMSPKESAELAIKGQAEARQVTQDAEQRRHNAVTEAISMGNLRVAQGHLAVARDKASQPADAKPSTAVQKRVLNFFNRAKQASDDIDAVSGEIAKMGLMGQARMSLAPNWLQTQTGQMYLAAQRAFTEARLRKDSGAAIPEHELENDRKTYFVQTGDTPATIAQKTRARSAVLASLAFESGSALREFYGDDAPGMVDSYRTIARGTGAPGSAAGTVRVKGKDGKTYEFPNQQAADNFKRAGG